MSPIGHLPGQGHGVMPTLSLQPWSGSPLPRISFEAPRIWSSGFESTAFNQSANTSIDEQVQAPPTRSLNLCMFPTRPARQQVPDVTLPPATLRYAMCTSIGADHIDSVSLRGITSKIDYMIVPHSGSSHFDLPSPPVTPIPTAAIAAVPHHSVGVRPPREILRPRPRISTTGRASGRGASADFKWLREESSRYVGQWVALRSGEVVDSDISLRSLRDRIRGRSDHDEMRLLQVPASATA